MDLEAGDRQRLQLARLHPGSARRADTRRTSRTRQALAADPYHIDALLGSGRVLLRQKRNNDAQARFESALSAATKGGDNPTVLSGRKADAEAKLGIGRALLALQQGADAKAKLTELSTQLPNDAEVVLALGETENVLGNPEGAETLFRKSIDLAPQEVRRLSGAVAAVLQEGRRRQGLRGAERGRSQGRGDRGDAAHARPVRARA